MELVKAIMKRKSIRYFKPHPVSKALLSNILEQATRASSCANTQPWEFAVFGGEVIKKMRKAYLERFESGVEPSPDIPEQKWPEPYCRTSFLA